MFVSSSACCFPYEHGEDCYNGLHYYEHLEPVKFWGQFPIPNIFMIIIFVFPPPQTSPEPPQSQHCGSNIVTYVHHREMLSRNVGTDGTNAETTVPPTATTPTVTPSNIGSRPLDLSMQQFRPYHRTAQTPGQYPPPTANQQFANVDGTGTVWQHYPPRSQIVSVPVSQPSMSIPHANVQYNVSNPPPPNHGQTGYGSGTVIGMSPQQQFGTNAGNPMLHQMPGSGYMTHSTNEYQQRFYGGSSPQPPLQRRQSPPGQHGNINSSNQHYHTGGGGGPQ